MTHPCSNTVVTGRFTCTCLAWPHLTHEAALTHVATDMLVALLLLCNITMMAVSVPHPATHVSHRQRTVSVLPSSKQTKADYSNDHHSPSTHKSRAQAHKAAC
jgi:hypothetical protein